MPSSLDIQPSQLSFPTSHTYHHPILQALLTFYVRFYIALWSHFSLASYFSCNIDYGLQVHSISIYLFLCLLTALTCILSKSSSLALIIPSSSFRHNLKFQLQDPCSNNTTHSLRLFSSDQTFTQNIPFSSFPYTSSLPSFHFNTLIDHFNSQL